MPFPSPVDLPDPGIEPASLTSPALAPGEAGIQTGTVDMCRSSPLGDIVVLEHRRVEIHLLAGARWRGSGEAKMAPTEKRKKRKKSGRNER